MRLFCAWFVMNEMINASLDQMSVVHMIVQIHINEEVNNGCLAGFLFWLVQFFLYVGLYNNLDVDDWNEAGFYEDVISFT